MSYKKNIHYLYIIIFFQNLIFAYVIERLFAIERGMTVQMVVYTEIIYALTIIILSVPAGIASDKFGRKRLIVVSAVFMCFEFGVLIFAQGFLLFGLSALIAGISGALTSGAWNSLLYDSLLASGEQDNFEKFLGRIRAVDFIAAMLAGLSGAFLAQWFDLAFNYWLSVGSAIIAFIFTLKLIEPPKSLQNLEVKAKAREIITAAAAFFKTHPDVLKIIIHATLIAAMVNYVDEFWQVYLNDIHFPVALFGIVMAALVITRAPGALLAAKLLKRFSHQKLIIISSFIVAFGILWAAYIKSFWGIFGMVAVCLAVALMEPVTIGYLHHRADPKARATIESIESMMHRVFTIGIGLAFGYFSTRFSIFTGFWLLSFAAIFVSVLFSLIKVKNNK
jgi:MFS family permease